MVVPDRLAASVLTWLLAEVRLAVAEVSPSTRRPPAVILLVLGLLELVCVMAPPPLALRVTLPVVDSVASVKSIPLPANEFNVMLALVDVTLPLEAKYAPRLLTATPALPAAPVPMRLMAPVAELTLLPPLILIPLFPTPAVVAWLTPVSVILPELLLTYPL